MRRNTDGLREGITDGKKGRRETRDRRRGGYAFNRLSLSPPFAVALPANSALVF